MSEINPKDGEWWMCYLTVIVKDLDWETQCATMERKTIKELPIQCKNGSFPSLPGQQYLPRYRLSRHTELNKLGQAQAEGKQLQFACKNDGWRDATLTSKDWRIKPEERPLVIDWSKVPKKYTKAIYMKTDGAIWFEGKSTKDFEMPIGFLDIDLTDVPTAATAERPE